MRIALFGPSGQVGLETLAAAKSRTGATIIPLSRAEADLARPGAGAGAILRLAPDAVINAAAFTQVDKAECEREAAFRINADAVGEIAAAAREVGARFVHLSTDYVFPGDSPEPLNEETPVGPLNVYGASKLRGEQLALDASPRSVILRTSWVYAAHGTNFVKTMLRLAETREEIGVVADQRGGPTPAGAIAAACLTIAERQNGTGGVYHFQGAPPASWADFAEAVFMAAGKRVRVRRITTADYPTPARRPLSTTLNCSKILRDYQLGQPDWRADITDLAARLAGSATEGAGA